MVTLTPSRVVGALTPTKSSPVHCRVVCARLRPLISSHVPDAMLAEPPKSPADATDETTGCATEQVVGGGPVAVAVAVNCTAGRAIPDTVAVTRTVPAVGPRVTVTAAMPSAS